MDQFVNRFVAKRNLSVDRIGVLRASLPLSLISF